MKSIIKNGENTTNGYPCLKEVTNVKGKIVVLFSEPEKGTIIWSDNKYHTVGAFSSTWIECFFDAFNGTIELSNN
jgi:hypothetical protein